MRSNIYAKDLRDRKRKKKGLILKEKRLSSREDRTLKQRFFKKPRVGECLKK